MNDPAFEVRWTEAAVADLTGIVEYIAQDSPTDAARQLDRIRERAATLVDTPLRGRVPPEFHHFGIGTWRELVIRPWRLVYRVEGNVVSVLAVLDARRDLEDILLERLTR
jgi:toxin ParE1/3/4